MVCFNGVRRSGGRGGGGGGLCSPSQDMPTVTRDPLTSDPGRHGSRRLTISAINSLFFFGRVWGCGGVCIPPPPPQSPQVLTNPAIAPRALQETSGGRDHRDLIPGQISQQIYLTCRQSRLPSCHPAISFVPLNEARSGEGCASGKDAKLRGPAPAFNWPAYSRPSSKESVSGKEVKGSERVRREM